MRDNSHQASRASVHLSTVSDASSLSGAAPPTASVRRAAKSLARLGALFATLPIFWTLYDQQGSAWVLQAKRMRLSVFGRSIEAEQVGIVNPLLLLVLIPVFESWIYPWARRLHRHSRVSHMRIELVRMLFGFLFASLAYVAAALLEYRLDAIDKEAGAAAATSVPAAPNGTATADAARSGRLPIAWQLPQIVLISIGEVFVSITGLEFAYAEAPPELKSVLTAVFYLTISAGDVLQGLVYNSLVWMGHARLNLVFAALIALNAVVYWHVAKKYVPLEQLKKNRREAASSGSPSPAAGGVAAADS